MSALLATIGRLLNPRPDFSWLPRAGTKDDHQPVGSGEKKSLPRRRGRLRVWDVLTNGPLMLGFAIVLGLFLIVLFGPWWAPENPYLAGQRIISYDAAGNLIVPPFLPSAELPLGSDQWGRDILSLLLYGTRNTLIACTFITMARLLLGAILGIIAGWNEGKLIDRIVMGGIGTTTALPILITSMILIYALDIRRGVPVFIMALSLVGWGEMAQYIRSEFMVIRQKPFIDGARVMGLRGFEIAVRHVLPNVLPQLVIITLLEMGAVLMLLGELGFVGVYIGGGIFTSDASDSTINYPDIPEWGAMMAGSWRWARATPWMVFYPALAFFLAVVGFNALGEGLRRLIEQGEFSTAVLLRKRMVLVIIAITAATVYIINNVGPAPSYARLAGEFNGGGAYEYVQALTQMDGRGNGQPGNQAAAEYIAERFHEYGLQPAGQGLDTYFYDIETRLVQPVEQPILALLDQDDQPVREFRHQLDYGFVIQDHGGSGDVQAPLAFVGFRQRPESSDEYRGLDLRGRIVFLLADNAPADFPTEALIRGAQGVIWVVGDERHAVRSQIQLAGPDRDYLRRPTMPVFRVRPAVAEALLEGEGLSLGTLRSQLDNWPEPGRNWLVRELGTKVQMSLKLTEPEDVALLNVLGIIPGKDLALNRQLVIVAAHYDGLGREPNGTVYPAANDDATGVATLLEIARLWHERDMKPRRTVLFAAWAGGNLERSGAADYILNYSGGLSILRPVAVFQLDNLGAGGDTLLISPGSGTVSDLLAWSADQIGLPVRRENREGYHAYQQMILSRRPSILVSWADSEVEPPLDALERISIEKLEAAGNAIALALIHASRQPSF